MRINANFAQKFYQEFKLQVDPFEVFEWMEFEPYGRIWVGCRIMRSRIGSYTSVSPNAWAFCATIGRYCSIGHNVEIGMSPHPVDWLTTSAAVYRPKTIGKDLNHSGREFDYRPRPIEVGHDVWIGAGALVPGGVKIGTGAIVAAGSVVTKDIPPYAIVGGNPAKIIRYRFEEDVIQALLASEWWQYDLFHETETSEISFERPLKALDDIRRMAEKGQIKKLNDRIVRATVDGDNLVLRDVVDQEV